MRRREFITLLGGAALAYPRIAGAQQVDRMRRIAVVTGFSQADREAQARIVSLRAGLQALGWSEGRNLHIDERWAGADTDLLRRYLDEMIALSPDLILTGHTLVAQLMRQAVRPIPTVFVGIADPLGSGVVPSLARPGGHVTGFTAFEYAIGGKWMSLLKQFAPEIKRVALLYNSNTAPWGDNFWRSFQATTPSFGVTPVQMNVRDAVEIEHAIEALAREPNGGLLGAPEVTVTLHRDLVIRLLAQRRLPAIFPYRYFPAAGGLASYGIDVIDQWQRAASYVDRILKGENPADLPVQAPTKFEFVINLKTAKALGLDVSEQLLLAADEVIE
jgi:putative tryptophan/tyrosine transport system substrate-binding protein